MESTAKVAQYDLAIQIFSVNVRVCPYRVLLSLLEVSPIASNFDCKGISVVIDSTNVYPQDIAFDCTRIASDCNDRAIQTAENKKSRLRSINIKSRERSISNRLN